MMSSTSASPAPSPKRFKGSNRPDNGDDVRIGTIKDTNTREENSYVFRSRFKKVGIGGKKKKNIAQSKLSAELESSDTEEETKKKNNASKCVNNSKSNVAQVPHEHASKAIINPKKQVENPSQTVKKNVKNRRRKPPDEFSQAQAAGDMNVGGYERHPKDDNNQEPEASKAPRRLYITIRTGNIKHTILKSTTRREPNSILAKLANGVNLDDLNIDQDDDGAYCFDDSPEFPSLLYFLKTGRVEEDDTVKLIAILHEAKYFEMDRMVIRLNTLIAERQKMLERMRSVFSENRSLFPSTNTVLENEISNMRRRFYVTWSNDSNYPTLFHNTYKDVLKFFATRYLNLDELINNDILEVIPKSDNNKFDETIKDAADTICVNAVVKDYPLTVNIPISEAILTRVDRSIATSKVKKLGYQHIFVSNYVVDSSTEASSAKSSNSESEMDKFSSPAHVSDLDTSLKTCQMAKNVNFEHLLWPHEANSTKISPAMNGVRVGILIFTLDKEICKSLAKFLGLIYLEEVVTEAKLDPDLNFAHSRAKNKHAKLYTFIQHYVSRKLVFGKNNIVITANHHYFQRIRADVKATMLPQGKCNEQQLEELVSIEIEMSSENAHILEYLQGINRIVNAILNVKVDVDTVFFSRKENKFYITQCPLFSVIPLFVLKNCAQLLHRDPAYSDYFSFKLI